MALIQVGELVGRADARICDVRWYLADPMQGRREYAEAHIPGAVFVDLDTVLTGDSGPGRHPLPTPQEFAADLGALGIGPETPVVAYDAAGGSIAARLWWMLRSIGHEQVAVLDGGIQAWVRAGHPVTTEIPSITPVDYPARAAWSGVADVEYVKAAAGRHTVIDARAPERYRGDFEPIDPRAGHIPGAINLPHSGNLDHDGLHLPADSLRRRFAAATPGTIVYCGSGITACANLLALDVAGLHRGLLYEGSWSDWSSHPDLPAATGE